MPTTVKRDNPDRVYVYNPIFIYELEKYYLYILTDEDGGYTYIKIILKIIISHFWKHVRTYVQINIKRKQKIKHTNICVLTLTSTIGQLFDVIPT